MALLVRLASYATVLAFAGFANAQTPQPTAGVATPPAAAAKPPATAATPPVAPPPRAPAPAPAPASSAPPVMSESKFLSALYSEIEKHTPVENTLGDGEVTASFHVNAAGRIDKVVIDKTTSPALSDAVRQILGAVAAPPPPGGAMDVGQTFKFHKTESEEAAPAPAAATAPASSSPAPAVTTKPAPTAPARQ